eukprot:TRINITY_DN690_c1_g3_i1.p1 TRINITY_DN690_c1_g3~~TRINITY_DN690_c1_g3_i1.p1  ORF type:complete len:294 (-),score=87.11 TRINITY_DN690_c1_g3_i1:642-1523(-)
MYKLQFVTRLLTQPTKIQIIYRFYSTYNDLDLCGMADDDSWENKSLDDWESKDVEDWEKEDFNPVVEKKTVVSDNKEGVEEDEFGTMIPLDEDKFEGEDEEDDDIVDNWEESTPKPQPKKKDDKKKYDESRGQVAKDTGVPLDDPAAEKQRLQRLIEEQDLKTAQELFGSNNNVEVQNPLDAMIPKSERDFEEYAAKLVELYISPHQKNKQYKKLLKEIMKLALEPATKDLAKEIEQSIAAIKSRKIKQENEDKQKAKSLGKKVNINVGSKGGDAGLDDYKYADDALDDDDFM